MYIKRIFWNLDNLNEIFFKNIGFKFYYKFGLFSWYLTEWSGCVRFVCVLRELYFGYFYILGEEFLKKENSIKIESRI